MIRNSNRRGSAWLGLSVATAVLVGCLAVGPAASQEDRTMIINGVTLQYVEQGAGEPVVFVHGSISDWRVWEGQREAIADDHTFIAYTRRYFGDRPWPDQGENFGDATDAADLVAFVEGLGRGPVHLIAVSGGGGVAILAALARPDLFRSMVLHEPGGATGQLLTSDEGRAANAERQAAQAPANAAVAAGNLDVAVELFLDATFNDPGAFDRMTPQQQAAHLASARTLALRGGARPPLTCEMLAGLNIPTEIIVGDRTLRYFDLIADELVRCLPVAVKVVLLDASHHAPEVAADRWNDLVLGFVREHGGG